MDLSWPWVIGGWVIALLAGGGGFALIHRAWVRPKVFLKADSWRLVPIRDDPRHSRAERVLQEQGLPTAVFEVKWWNAGRRTAKEIDVELRTSGEVVDISVSPSADDLEAPWKLVKAPEDYEDTDGLRIQQPELKSNGEVRATIGYEAPDDEEDEPEVRGYFGDQSITDVDQPSRNLLQIIPLIVIFVGLFIYMGIRVVQDADTLAGGLVEALGGLLASMAGAGIIIYLIHRWTNWIANTVHKPPSERG